MSFPAKSLNTFGLIIVIVGCVLLYFFGLPPPVRPSGESYLVMEQVDQSEIEKGKLYRKLGRYGIGLVGLGSLLQVFATWC